MVGVSNLAVLITHHTLVRIAVLITHNTLVRINCSAYNA